MIQFEHIFSDGLVKNHQLNVMDPPRVACSPTDHIEITFQVQSYNRVQSVQPAQSEGEEIKIHKRVNWLPLGLKKSW